MSFKYQDVKAAVKHGGRSHQASLRLLTDEREKLDFFLPHGYRSYANEEGISTMSLTNCYLTPPSTIPYFIDIQSKSRMNKEDIAGSKSTTVPETLFFDNPLGYLQTTHRDKNSKWRHISAYLFQNFRLLRLLIRSDDQINKNSHVHAKTTLYKTLRARVFHAGLLRNISGRAGSDTCEEREAKLVPASAQDSASARVADSVSSSPSVSSPPTATARSSGFTSLRL
jgi:hypothetical protein